MHTVRVPSRERRALALAPPSRCPSSRLAAADTPLAVTETPAVSASVTRALAELYEATTRAHGYGPAHAGFVKHVALSPARDIRAEVARILPFLRDFSRFVVPAAATRGELLRGLVPLAERLGACRVDTALGAPALETVRLLSAFADVLTTWDGDRKTYEPRFVLVGDEPWEPSRHNGPLVRGHVVVLDPLGPTGEPGLGATLVWLSGVRVGRASPHATVP